MNLLCSLWGVGVGLYNGFTFNRHYFEHVRGNAAAPTRPGLMGIALAVQAVAGIALAAVMLAGLGTELGRGIRSEVGGLLDNSMPYEDVQGGGHSDPQGNTTPCSPLFWTATPMRRKRCRIIPRAIPCRAHGPLAHRTTWCFALRACLQMMISALARWFQL